MQRLNNLTDRVIHRVFGRPYRLATASKSGQGQVVVLLHGIGRSGKVWNHVVAGLSSYPVQVVAFDLLGFGDSPKPDWLQYNADDHARAVIWSIRAEQLEKPIILVGHSMGCLVAARVAVMAPDLVSRLVLYEMPLYKGLPETRRYRAQIDLYYAVYKKIIGYTPSFGEPSTGRIRKIAEKLINEDISPSSWLPFVRSLEHTIMEQTTDEDIKKIAVPIEIIYGARDILVIRGKVARIFGSDSAHISAKTINARHSLSSKASSFLVKRIVAASQKSTSLPD